MKWHEMMLASHRDLELAVREGTVGSAAGETTLIDEPVSVHAVWRGATDRCGSRRLRLPVRLLGAASACVLALAGCGGESRPEPEASPIGTLDDGPGVADETELSVQEPDDDPTPELDPDLDPDPDSEPEENTGDDPYVMPEEINDEYVDSVMNYIVQSGNDILIDVVSRDVGLPLSGDNSDMIEALYSGARLEFAYEDFEQIAADESQRQDLFAPDEIGQTYWSTVLVLEADEDCIITAGYQDLTEVTVGFRPNEVGVLASLSPAEVTEQNPTGWKLRDLVAITSGGEPVPEDQWDEIEFWDVVDNTCDR